MKKSQIIILVIIILIVSSGVVFLYPRDSTPSTGYSAYLLNYDQSMLPLHKTKSYNPPELVEVGRLINVVADEEWSETHQNGGASFCRLLFFDDTFYVFVLSGRVYYVRGFDQDWQFTGFEKRLTSAGDVDIDQDIAFDGEYVYEYVDINGPKGRVRKFDKNFNLVKETPIITTGPGEEILDQNLALINGKIYAGSEYRENGSLWSDNRPREMSNIPPNTEVNRGMRIRIYDKELNALGIKDLVANISGAVIPNQYWALGASQFYADGYHCIAAVSPIGNITYFNVGESIGARQLFILRFDDDFNFVDSKGPLSDTGTSNSWCTGSLYEDGRYYIVYCTRRPGEGQQYGPGSQPPNAQPGGISGMGHIMLGIYDDNFNELETILLTSAGGSRPQLFKMENKLYVTYDTTRGEAFVQELILKN